MIADSVFIKLVRKGAGVGPDYSLKISGRGTVIYEGFENVEIKGERKEKIEKQKIVTLLSEFKKADFFSLNDVYPIESSDGRSSCIIGISVTDKNGGTKTKNITHFHGDKNVPRKLLNLEDKIDRIARSKKWVGDPSKVLQAKNEPSSKKVESIVTKHEKTADVRKPVEPSFISKKLVAVIALFVIILLVLFFVFQSGIFNDIFTESKSNGNTIAVTASVEIVSNHLIGYSPLIVHFNGTTNNFDADLLYIWNFDGNNISYEKNPVHVFKNPGLYNVSLTVTNNKGTTIRDTFQINVKNSTSVINAGITLIPLLQTGFVPLNASFTSNIVGGNAPYDYYWDLGNGEISMDRNVNFTYITKGIYTVNLYVTDSDGYSSSDHTEVHCK